MIRFLFTLFCFTLCLITHLQAYEVNDKEEGYASFYSDDLNGHQTASGEIYHKNEFTAAHRRLPFNSLVEVRNLKNGKTVQVRITDRGPFGKSSRIIDLSRVAARQIGLGSQGTVKVELRVVKLGVARRSHY